MMVDLNDLILFATILESGNFSEAARRLGMPVSTISRRVAGLEERFGVRLIQRSTRRLGLTEAGEMLLNHARQARDLSEAVDALMTDRHGSVSGLVRLSAPPSVSETLLAPLMGTFQAKHPDVRMHVLVTDRHVDHIADGVDLALRFGPQKDSALVTQKLLTYRHRLVAGPEYLARQTAPTVPGDLLGHRLLSFSHGRPEGSWTFVHTDDGDRRSIEFLPHLSMNDYDGLAARLLAGDGIGDLPPVVRPDLLRDGRLVEVMPDWRFEAHDLVLLHLGRRHLSRPLRAFKDHALQMAPVLFPALPT